MSSSDPNASETMPVGDLLAPLAVFYRQAGLAVPVVGTVPGSELPEPYRGLLVHERDMTSTLEAFFGQRVHVRRLDARRQGETLYREVVLCGDDDQRAVEFGAIEIHLGRFPSAARHDIEGERLPLGRILAEHAIPYESRPRHFFRWSSDELTARALRCERGEALFGRHNVLARPDGAPLAEAVEILPRIDISERTDR